MRIFRTRPNCCPEMLALMERGYDVVSAQRMTRTGDSLIKRLTAKMFYWLMRKMVDERVRPEVARSVLTGFPWRANTRFSQKSREAASEHGPGLRTCE
jgi:hypothetical protein